MRCRKYPDWRYAQSVPKSPLPALDGTLGEYGEALTLVRALATPAGWDNADRSPYRRYSFPRSALLSAIEEAVAGSAPASASTSAREDTPVSARPDQQAAFRQLIRPRRRKPDIGSLSALRSLMAVLMPVVAIVLSVELTALSTPQRAPLVLSLTGLLVLVSWGVLLFRQSHTAPLSGFFPASHWFATSTFILTNDEPGDEEPPGLGWLTVLLPRWSRRMRAVREERARMILSQLSTAFYRSPSGDDATPGHPEASPTERERAMRLYLSLRVHALLEDLRANYRPWTLDLRRRKRKWPPMLFLPDMDPLVAPDMVETVSPDTGPPVAPDTGNQPGCVRFVQAVSDLRSRRSEADPLLILGSSRHPLHAHPGPEPGNSRHSPHNEHSSYKRWIGRLRVEQSPSFGERLPWVLLQEVRADRCSLSTDRQRLPGWSVWHLWSRWTVAFAVALLCIGGLWRSRVIGAEYCDGWLFGYDPNLVLVNGKCIGTDTTNAAEFLPAGPGVALTDTMTAPGTPPAVGAQVSLSQVNLAYLENLIDNQNQEAATSGPYVTFVFAGALTAPANSRDPLNALEQLAGVYAWQYYVNATMGYNVKIRIDIANDGDGSDQEQQMAETIVAAAHQDPSIDGVIGLGTDAPQSASAIQDFAKADLPVIDPTNSDDDFQQDDWNYFGLSATNAEEAQALVTRYARRGAGRHAVVFERIGTAGQSSADPYASQQAQSAEADLRKAGFKLVGENGNPGPITYTTQANLAGSPGIVHAVCAAHPSVVYLAGRNADMKNLVGLLDQRSGCFPARVTVLSGDDMAVTEFPGNSLPALAPGMTLYYVAQTDPDHVGRAAAGGPGSADNGSGLNADIQGGLRLNGTPGYSDPVFANGIIALGFDAAHLLYSASTTSAGAGNQEQVVPRDAVIPGLRCPQEPVSNGATGPVGFADVHHGLDFFKAVNATSGPNAQRVTFQSPHQQAHPGKCAPNVAP
ncbi:MAG TPA: ABC transporter substrate-binding protein [Trebonia sp.]